MHRELTFKTVKDILFDMILIINAGSTSVKYKIFGEDEGLVKEGVFNMEENIDDVIKKIIRDINNINDIKAIGHRVVHGGDKYVKPVLLDEEIINDLDSYSDLAPLHNPISIAGIKACYEFLPNIPQIAVFDTAFYSDMPKIAKTYAIPKEIAKELNVKKYGFHGLSHSYASVESAKQLDKDVDDINIISCHLGGGWSITAIKNGIPIDTSMGMTPVAGLMMMTRSGDIDPGIILKIVEESNINDIKEAVEYAENIINNKSGILGLGEGIDDYQELLKEVSMGDESSKFIFNLAIYNLIKFIGAYWVILEAKVDAIVFTGSIGSGNPMTRNAVMSKLKFLGELRVLPIKSNEGLMIVREVRELLDNSRE